MVGGRVVLGEGPTALRGAAFPVRYHRKIIVGGREVLGKGPTALREAVFPADAGCGDNFTIISVFVSWILTAGIWQAEAGRHLAGAWV